MKFQGYRRPDGSAGVRNHVLILPTVGCATETCRIISGLVYGSVSLINQNGCGEVEGNRKLTQNVLAGFAANPNVYGTLLVGLGCELNPVDDMAALIRSKTNKPLHTLIIQEEGGTVNTICRGVKIAQHLVSDASSCVAEEMAVSELVLGIECGGSDATSGLAANPVMGFVSDSLVDLGGTAMFSETPEIVGAEHILARRCKTPEMGRKILDFCVRLEADLARSGESLRSGQPSPGNKAGGITTLEEKSLGCINKGGTQPISEVVECAQKPSQRGLVYMDTPGYDPLSVTAKAAAGCQIIVFTTGRGSPIGNPIAPVLKLTANRETFAKMNDNIDMDLSAVLRGEQTIEEAGKQVLAEIVKTAIAPIAGTNIEPSTTDLVKFGNCQLPIYLSTSSYDVRRLQAATSRINDNLANQVKRWSGFNGVAPFNFDFDTYKLSGFKGDSWSVETLNNEYASYTWYLNNNKGIPMVAPNYVKDLIHALYPQNANFAWEYMKHFSRDQKTGAIQYNPYIISLSASVSASFQWCCVLPDGLAEGRAPDPSSASR